MGSHKKDMPRILVFLNEITHISIPFELTVRIAADSNINIVIASLYSKDQDGIAPMSNEGKLPIQVRTFSAKSRFDRQAWSAFDNQLTQKYDLVHTHNSFPDQ